MSAEHPTDESALESDEDFDAILAKQAKARKVTMIVVAAVGLMLIATVSVYIATQPDPKCDSEDVDFFVSDRSLPPATVGRVCSFSPALAGALRDAEAAPPEYAGVLVMAAVTEAPELITDVCSGGIRGLAESGAFPGTEKNSVFLDHCDLSETEINMSSAKTAAFDRLVMAVAVYGDLAKSDPADAGRIANRVLGR